MFTIIQEPWELFKPPNRKNFLSYPYVLYKFSELLEKDSLLCYFPMLQPQKLMEQDMSWSKFCKFLNLGLGFNFDVLKKLFSIL